jgi:hypothetical protein
MHDKKVGNQISLCRRHRAQKIVHPYNTQHTCHMSARKVRAKLAQAHHSSFIAIVQTSIWTGNAVAAASTSLAVPAVASCPAAAQHEAGVAYTSNLLCSQSIALNIC